jgi:hypothetical protein
VFYAGVALNKMVIHVDTATRKADLTQLKSKTLTIAQLFSQEYFFRVPEYQRPFSWDEENLRELIDDLMTARRDADYFLGTLVLHNTHGNDYDIIDGQQRLTALCILLACIRDLPCLKADDEIRSEIQEKIQQPKKRLERVPARHRLVVRDQAVFNGMVIAKNGTEDHVILAKPTPIEERYVLARNIFRARLESLDEDRTEKLLKFVYNRCVVIFLAASEFAEAFRLFTVVNDRGKQLRRIDILKANNIDPALIPDDETRKRYAQEWETMENNLGEKHFEDLFHLMRLIFVKDKPQHDLVKEFESRIFNQPEFPDAGKRFIDELSVYVKLYDELFVSRDFLDSDDDDSVKFNIMMWAMVTYFNASEWQACVLAYAKKFGRQGIYNYILALEKVYLTHWVAGMRKDERYEVYTDLLKAIDSGPDHTTAFKVANDRSDLGAIQDACGVENFYSVGYCRYLLLRAEFSAGENQDIRQYTVRSIEHVLPQNPKPGSEWFEWFTKREVSEVVNKAGNLVLLSKGKNSSASNKEFGDKKSTYLNPRVSDFPRSMQVLSYPVWTKEIIDQRTFEFAKLVIKDPWQQ